MRTIPKLFFSSALAGSVLVLAGCQTAEPYVSYPYEVTAQNARILKRLDVKDVAVDQVRVVKAMDLECAGNNISIPGQEGFKTIIFLFPARKDLKQSTEHFLIIGVMP